MRTIYILYVDMDESEGVNDDSRTIEMLHQSIDDLYQSDNPMYAPWERYYNYPIDGSAMYDLYMNIWDYFEFPYGDGEYNEFGVTPSQEDLIIEGFPQGEFTYVVVLNDWDSFETLMEYVGNDHIDFHILSINVVPLHCSYAAYAQEFYRYFLGGPELFYQEKEIHGRRQRIQRLRRLRANGGPNIPDHLLN